MQNPRKSLGFTLIEILIAIAIVGILAGIAVPSYSKYLVESRRIDAHIGLRDAGQRLERCRTQSFTYVGCTAPATSPEGHYDLAYTTLTGTTYTATATPVTGGPQAGDNDCASLVLTQDGQGTATAGTGGDSSNCW